MEQTLIVNCSICDARNVAEETLQAYEKIIVNCSIFCVSPQSQPLLDRYPVVANCAKVLRLGPEVVLKIFNGAATIGPGPAPRKPVYLVVNGSLTIEPGTQEVLSGYAGCVINGSLLAPRGTETYLPALDINGRSDFYPENAILLKRTAEIDRLFPLRAKAERLYWAPRQLVFLDGSLDVRTLAVKNVRFGGPKALIARSLAKDLVPLLTDETELEVVEDGTSLIRDDLELTSAVLTRCGTRLYVLGDLTVTQDSREALGQVQWLKVTGTVSLPQSLAEDFARIPAQYQKLHYVRGQLIEDRTDFRLTRKLLERTAEGLTLRDCVKVSLDADIPESLILERLHISDCVTVFCTPAQQDVLNLVCEDVVSIRTGEDPEPADKGDTAGPENQPAGNSRPKVINTADYIL